MSDKKELSLVQEVNKELVQQTNDPATMRALMATTFKGFKSENLVKQACLEVMMNGYSFEDLVRKKVYAIPYGEGYSIVESISNVRAKAMKGGQTGKSAPVFVDDEKGNIISCAVTIYRTGGHESGYTAVVYFNEYDKKFGNWKDKPRTMIAKVAEMHALRMAFPAELSTSYIEDEFNEDQDSVIAERKEKAKVETEPLKIGNVTKKDNESENQNQNQNKDQDEESAE